jgi:hypothetical protein
MADFGESVEETDRQMIYEGGSVKKQKQTPDIMSADGGKSTRSHRSQKPLS